MKVREFTVVVPLTLPSPGRVEDEINQFSRTLTPKIPTLFITPYQAESGNSKFVWLIYYQVS